MPSNNVEINVKATAQFAEVGRLAHEIDALTVQIKKAEEAANRSANTDAHVGQLKAQLAAATRQYKEALNLASGAQQQFSGTGQVLRGVLEGLAGKAGLLPGPFGKIAASLTETSLLAGAGVGAFGALAGAMIAGAARIASYQEELDLMAASTSFTTGEIAGMRTVASETGISVGVVDRALSNFASTMGEAKDPASQAAKNFRDIGISVTDSAGHMRAAGDAFREAQDYLRGLKSDQERINEAEKLFGPAISRNAAALTALLTPLDQAEAKARKLGLALGPEGEAVARRADAAFDQLGSSLTGLGNAFGVTSAQILGPFLNALARAASEAAELANNPDLEKVKDLYEVPSGAPEAGGVTLKAPPRSIAPPRGPSSSADEEDRRQDSATRAKYLNVLEQERLAREKLKVLAEQTLPTLDRQVQIGAITLQQEIDKLKSMKEQATTAEELEAINGRLADAYERQAAAAKRIADEVKLGITRNVPGFDFEAGLPPPRPQYQPLPDYVLKRLNEQLYQGPAKSEQGEMNVPDVKRGEDELMDFLDSLGEKAPDVLRKARIGTDQFSAALIGYQGVMAKTKLSQLDLGKLMANQVLSLAQTVGFAAAQLMTGQAKFTDALAMIMKAILQAAAQMAAASIGGPGGMLVGGLLSGFASVLQQGGTIRPLAAAQLQMGGTVRALGGDGAYLSPIQLQAGGSITRLGASRIIHAQSGVIVSGIRGADTAPALLGQGETVLSHRTTDRLEAFLERALRAPAQQASANGSAGARRPVVVEMHLHGAGDVDWRKITRRYIIPEIYRADERGTG